MLKVFETRGEWLDGRRVAIGSSDGPAILGFGYASQSRTVVYASKVYSVEEHYSQETLRLMDRGKVAEEFIIRMFAADHPDWNVRHNNGFSFYRHPEIGYLSASIDGDCEVEGEKVVIEAKMIGRHAAHEWDDGQPTKYVLQVMHQLICTGWKYGYLVGLVAGDFVVHKIERDEELIEQMLIAYDQFWFDHVLARVPPTDDESDVGYKALRNAIKTESFRAKQLGSGSSSKVREYFDLVKEVEAKTKSRDSLRNAIGRETVGFTHVILDDQSCVKIGKTGMRSCKMPNGIEVFY